MPISIEPENPTTSTAVTLSFVTFSKCPEVTQTIEGSEFVFEVEDSTTSGFCLSTAAPFNFTWDVGTLEAGNYQVTHISPWLDTESQSFTVAAAAAQAPPVGLPAIGPVAVLVLVLAVALLTRRVHRLPS